MRQDTSDSKTRPTLIFWIIAGWAGFLILPWYGIADGFFAFEWLFDGYPWDTGYAPAVFIVAQGEKLWLAPMVLPLLGALFALNRLKSDPLFAKTLILTGAFGFCWLMMQGFGIGLRGWQFGWLETLFGPLGDRQFGMGYGAMFMASAFLFLFTHGIAARVENNDYGLAIAYSTTLIVVMLAAVRVLQMLVGRIKIGRRAGAGTT